MAKGLRSSRTKVNKTKLRNNVFGPVEDARAARLNAKLLELAQKPKPNEMEIEGESKDNEKGDAQPMETEEKVSEAVELDSDEDQPQVTKWHKKVQHKVGKKHQYKNSNLFFSNERSKAASARRASAHSRKKMQKNPPKSK